MRAGVSPARKVELSQCSSFERRCVRHLRGLDNNAIDGCVATGAQMEIRRFVVQNFRCYIATVYHIGNFGLDCCLVAKMDGCNVPERRKQRESLRRQKALSVVHSCFVFGRNCSLPCVSYRLAHLEASPNTLSLSVGELTQLCGLPPVFLYFFTSSDSNDYDLVFAAAVCIGKEQVS